jgi:regulator of protease activity HflC (stomatin/prohibitin superfamily)
MQGPFAVLFITFWIVVAFILLIGLFSGFFTVQQQSRAIVERFGRYLKTAKPGLNFKVPYIDYVVQRVSLRVQQLPVEVETKTLLDASMKIYGFEIPNALVTDVNPADNVKAAMNDIQTQQRLQIAAAAKGEANKILVIKNAEAEAESKRLQGEGIAKERRAIIDGLRESIAAFTDQIGGVSAPEVLKFVLLTQYFDTMKDIGVSAGSKVILMPHSPGGMNDIAEQLQTAIIAGNEAAKTGK